MLSRCKKKKKQDKQKTKAVEKKAMWITALNKYRKEKQDKQEKEQGKQQKVEEGVNQSCEQIHKRKAR